MDDRENDKISQSAPTEEAEVTKPPISGVDVSRRSLTKAGFAMPALITLASRPVFGAQCNPSTLSSGNLSDPVDYSTCGTCSNSFWAGAWLGVWDRTDYGPSDSFRSIFYASTNPPRPDNTCSPRNNQGNPRRLHPFKNNASFPDTLEKALKNELAVADRLKNYIDCQFGIGSLWESDLKNLAQQAVATLLNTSHPLTNSGYSLVQDVIDDFTAAFSSFVDDGNASHLTTQAALFEAANQVGVCPLGDDPPTP